MVAKWKDPNKKLNVYFADTAAQHLLLKNFV